MDQKFATPEATMSRLPAWVAYDRKVLRFSGYFKEAVHASSAETWRARKCLIYFYMEDDSVRTEEGGRERDGEGTSIALLSTTWLTLLFSSSSLADAHR